MDRRMIKISERDSKNHLIDTMQNWRVTLAIEKNVKEWAKASVTMSVPALNSRNYMGVPKMKMTLSKTKTKIKEEANAINSVASYFAAWTLMCIMVRNGTRE